MKIFFFLISQFQTFSSPYLRYFTLNLIHNWLPNDPNSLPVSNLQIILFDSKSFPSVNDLIIYSDIFAKCQLDLLTVIDQEQYSLFWKSFFSVPNSIQMRFLYFFSIAYSENPKQMRLLSETMGINGVDQILFPIVMDSISQNVQESFTVLTQMLVWFDASAVIAHPTFKIIFQNLENPDFVGDSLDVINGIFISQTDPQILIQLAQESNMIEILSILTSQTTSEDVLLQIASIIQSVGFLFLNIQPDEKCTLLAIQLFLHSNDSISYSVFEYLSVLMNVFPDKIVPIFFLRLQSFFRSW